MAKHGWVNPEDRHYAFQPTKTPNTLDDVNTNVPEQHYSTATDDFSSGVPPHLWRKENLNLPSDQDTIEIERDDFPFTIGDQPSKPGDEPRYHPAIESIRQMRRFITRDDPTSHRQSRGDPLTAGALRVAHLGGSPAVPRKTHRDAAGKGNPGSIRSSQVSLVSGEGREGLVRTTWKGDDNSEHEDWHPDRTQFRDFVMCWLQGIPEEQPIAVFTTQEQHIKEHIKEHYLHDIDTYTGKLIEPVTQPRAMPYVDTYLSPRQLKELFDNLNQTSWGQIHGYGKQKARVSSHSEAQKAPIHFSAPVVQKANPTGRHVGLTCHLRPATEEDLRGVSKIYNWEVKNGFQAADTEPINEGDLSRILSSCMKMHVPFVVAVEGTVADSESKKLHKRDDFSASAFRNWPGLLEMTTDKVIGFAFVYFHDRGLGGKPTSSMGSFTGKLFLCVDPNFRRKGVGMALMDKVLACCCTRWFAGDYYTFNNPENDRLYSSSTLNSCRLMRLFVDVLYKTKDETEFGARTQENRHWYEKFLTKTFPFKELVQFDHYHRRELDTPFWVDKVTYQVVCRRPDESYDH